MGDSKAADIYLLKVSSISSDTRRSTIWLIFLTARSSGSSKCLFHQVSDLRSASMSALHTCSGADSAQACLRYVVSCSPFRDSTNGSKLTLVRRCHVEESLRRGSCVRGLSKRTRQQWFSYGPMLNVPISTSLSFVAEWCPSLQIPIFGPFTSPQT